MSMGLCQDLTGKRFGLLFVERSAQKRPYSPVHGAYWQVSCTVCGKLWARKSSQNVKKNRHRCGKKAYLTRNAALAAAGLE